MIEGPAVTPTLSKSQKKKLKKAKAETQTWSTHYIFYKHYI
jgi:hypothetical protein